MSTTLHVGKKRVQTVSTSDGSTLAPGAVSAASTAQSVAFVAVDPATNEATVTGMAPGTATINYSADGYTGTSETVTVAPIPSLIVTDGPEQ